MLTIRLRRTGKKKKPSYRIVVADNRAPIYGNYIEMIGTYDPFTKAIILDQKKALSFMDQGAKPTNTVSKIFQNQGLKHKSIVIKKFRAVSKKELEAQKAQEEAEKAKVQAEKEAAKVAFEQQVEAEKAAQPSSEEKLQQAADVVIQEEKAEEQAKEETKEEAKVEKKTEE
ncbi:MAG: 30S ribosomal protein S16 [Patescibacteria group bacterium]|nr:30S ribosomal protein S16 [Patescibacteria group bacterium]